MLNKKTLVPIPNVSISKKRSPNKKYTYIHVITGYYRNKNGTATNNSKSIGRLDEKTGMLIPNNYYYEKFGEVDVKIAKDPIVNFGGTLLLSKIFKDLGLDEILDSAFSKPLSDKIKTIAKYITLDSNIMFYIDEFCASNHIEDHAKVTSQSSTNIFNAITQEDTMEFHKAWVKKVKSNEYIAYDVSSISSYSTNQDDVEVGYNRDKESLSQFNIGMYYGQKSKLPIYYTKYAGSIVDKSHLRYMMENNKELNLKNVNFVMDRGFYSNENIKYMHENNLPYMICVSNALVSSKKLFEKHLDKLGSFESNMESHIHYSGIQDEITFSGKKVNAFIYLDDDKALAEKNKLFTKVKRLRFELEQYKKINKKQYKYYNKYFDIDYNEDSGEFSFKENAQKIDIAAKILGCFIIVSNFKDINLEEAITIYRKRDGVEKLFYNLKNFLDLKRIHTHSKSTTDGKLFASFISLILKSQVENVLKDYFKKNNSTVRKVFKELDKIRISNLDNKSKIISPLTHKQKEILSYFGITESDIINQVRDL